MSKEMKALDALEIIVRNGYISPNVKELKIIKKELKEREKYRKRCLELEEKLAEKDVVLTFANTCLQGKRKALEIIKEKGVDVYVFQHSGDLQTYNDMVEDSRKLTQEEFDLLKEALL